MYTLEVLANRAEIHKKWNHTYIQQGLLPPPLVMDNGDFYSDAHLERLLLRELAEEGISVSRMSAYLNGERKCLRHSMEEREMSTGCGGENFFCCPRQLCGIGARNLFVVSPGDAVRGVM